VIALPQKRRDNMYKMVIRHDPNNSSVKQQLNEYGYITYEPDLLSDILFYESIYPLKFVEDIDGVMEVREQYIYKVNL
jgi:hypothetical protein